MFRYRARTRNAPAFKRLLETVRDLSSNPVMRLTPERMHFQGMDSAHILLAVFELAGDFFEEMECPAELVIAFRTAALCRVLHFCDEGDIVSFGVDAAGDALQLAFDSGPAVPYERHASFRLPLLQAEAELLAVPPRSYEAVVTMHSGEFFALVRSLAQTTECANFIARVKPRSFAISYDGRGGSGEVVFAEREGAGQGVQLDIDSPVERQFSLQLLNSLGRAAALSDRVSLAFGRETPLLLTFSLGGDSRFQAYVAPRAAGD